MYVLIFFSAEKIDIVFVFAAAKDCIIFSCHYNCYYDLDFKCYIKA